MNYRHAVLLMLPGVVGEVCGDAMDGLQDARRDLGRRIARHGEAASL